MCSFLGFFAKLHGGDPIAGHGPDTKMDDLRAAYAQYADAVRLANDALQAHGPTSREFKKADTDSMKLFHRAKRLQGFKKKKGE